MKFSLCTIKYIILVFLFLISLNYIFGLTSMKEDFIVDVARSILPGRSGPNEASTKTTGGVFQKMIKSFKKIKETPSPTSGWV